LENLKRRRQHRLAFAMSALYQRVGGGERICRAAQSNEKGMQFIFLRLE
jgi:hypothetical protein